MGFPKGRSGSSSLWSTTGFKSRGRYNLIVLSEVEFILQVIAGVSQFLFDDLAGRTVTAEAFESLLAGLFYTEAWEG